MKIMKKEIILTCSAQKVWEMFTNKSQYEIWTKAFSPTSTYSGKIEQDEIVEFLDGTGFGLRAKVTTYVPYTEIVFTFEGEIVEGKLSDGNDFVGGTESYLLKEEGNQTHLTIKLVVEEKYYDEMTSMWDGAIIELVKLSEV